MVYLFIYCCVPVRRRMEVAGAWPQMTTINTGFHCRANALSSPGLRRNHGMGLFFGIRCGLWWATHPPPERSLLQTTEIPDSVSTEANLWCVGSPPAPPHLCNQTTAFSFFHTTLGQYHHRFCPVCLLSVKELDRTPFVCPPWHSFVLLMTKSAA